MNIYQQFVIVITKLVSLVISAFSLGAGGTWPGEIALLLDQKILKKLLPRLTKGVIIVAGTNGKTTTSLIIKQILEHEGSTVIHNSSGANLLNGIVSAFIQKADWLGTINADWGVFEVDENSLPLLVENINRHSERSEESSFSPGNNDASLDASPSVQHDEKKIIIVLLNLFRDQLDRYGEVDVIAEKWGKALHELPNGTEFVLNADDPLIAHLGKIISDRIMYFGIENKKQFLKNKEHATDSTFCLNCGHRLTYSGIYFSHLGVWHCAKCGEMRPKLDISKVTSPLPGLYNEYNTLAAVGVGKLLGIDQQEMDKSLKNFKPAFGRQEEFVVDNRKIKIFLSKNPAGFNASLRTVLELKPKVMLLVLNDRIPDGRDVSWIWDVDFEMVPENIAVIVSGDRVYDMALRIKYAQRTENSELKSQRNSKLVVESELVQAINKGLELISKNETLYVLATYSAMLEVRKIITGKKIL